jgi:hypothetical protein
MRLYVGAAAGDESFYHGTSEGLGAQDSGLRAAWPTAVRRLAET